MTEHKKQTIVLCPTCNKPVPWNDKQNWKPFCSERCKLIDLGEWVNERHHIPGDDFYPGEDEI